MAYVRKFKTTSGATGVQVCYKEGSRVVRTVHVGSAATEEGIARLVREARRIIDGDGLTLFNVARYEVRASKKPKKPRGGGDREEAMRGDETEK